ncbi:Alpha-L-fucosidase [Penicillium daleae]|uniref:Alpha-L-fucosidase n=1 Tax=Penicillium daleae TaxID=63821 RepID=A0AAD6C5Y3_9EURO|nr:Alpha-L-fucosidase [Penicillium daleae]KAJ5453407.1 Alpha-L-fucosidase [Penicillium daleae]
MASESLWYNTPATCWQEGLPIGNGRLGAVIQSALHHEIWYLTEVTFWSANPEKYFANDFLGGKKLSEQYLQPLKNNFGTNLTVAKVSMQFDHPAGAVVSDFRRVLSLEKATIVTEYKVNGHQYHRETWISHPQQVLVSRYSTDAPDGISLRLRLDGDSNEFRVTPSVDGLEFDTRAVETAHSDGTCGVRGHGSVWIQPSPGISVETSIDNHAGISKASSACIMVAFNTDFRRESNENRLGLSAMQLQEAQQKTYKQLYLDHLPHVFTNVWGFTDPGWETSWGLNVTGGLWLATHMIEYYEYTLDLKFLEQQAYPVLKQAAIFFLGYMVNDPRTGYLVTGPSVSPENSFFPYLDGSEEQQLSLGPTIDIILIRDLFNFCITAAQEPSVDTAFTERLREALASLPPLQIDRKANSRSGLKTTKKQSLIIASCRTPSPSAVHIRTTLINRQSHVNMEDIEFTAALLGLNFARLNDGESALRHLGHLIGDLSFDNLLTYSKAGIAGAEKNIFVIDGNMGGTALMSEMLLRSSRVGEIELLPALPLAWNDGSVQGLRTRGNMTVGLEWRGGKLVDVNLSALSPTPLPLQP